MGLIPFPSILAALGLALALSLGANAWLVHLYTEAHAEAATAAQREKTTAGTAKACSDGVESLRAAGERRAAQAEDARDAALTVAKGAQLTAQKLLAKPPAVAGDDCASARAQIDDWIKSRRAGP